MEKNDLTFVRDDGVFNYRVGAIIIHNNKLLVVSGGSGYFYSVGGRVKMNETAQEAVVRECFEETGKHFKIDRLGFVHEKFFPHEVYKDKIVHEVSMYFYMKPLENQEYYDIKCTSINEMNVQEEIVWLDLDSIDKCTVYPEFFKTELSQDRQVKYIVEKQ